MSVVATRSTRMIIALIFGWHILISYIKASEKHVLGFAKVIESLLKKMIMFYSQ